MTCWAVVAVKLPATGKGRLAEVLSVEQRQQLVQRMFKHVVGVLRRARSIDGIAVVTPEPQGIAALLGESLSAFPPLLLLEDPHRGLNGAFAHAAVELARRKVDELLVLHADLPLLDSVEIEGFVTAGRVAGFAIAPDKLGQGTNGLFLGLPTTFKFQFGVGSCALHCAEAARHRWPENQVRLPGFEFDVDEPEDLMRLQQERSSDYDFLQEGAGAA